MSPEVRIICGVGGVGKTTLAAAMAVSAAARGHRVVVLTIDPARRLADALGVTLDNDPRLLDLQGVRGSLHAAMLDRKAMFDTVIRRYAPSPEVADRLLANRYYAAVSTRLAGSQEYMATEKLYELANDGRWDVIVVDTPPSQHALDFLLAPDRIRGLLTQRALRALLEPGGWLGLATRRVVDLVRRIAGDQVIADLVEFFDLFGALAEGFRDRGQRVGELLASDRTRFYLVASTRTSEVEGPLQFSAALRDRGAKLSGIVVNRVTEAPPDLDVLAALGPAPEAGGEAAWREVAAAIDAAARRTQATHQRESVLLRRLRQEGLPVWTVPEVDAPTSISDLARLSPHLP